MSDQREAAYKAWNTMRRRRVRPGISPLTDLVKKCQTTRVKPGSRA